MINNKKQKLYCYVDETGQDTKGMLFLVSVVISDATRKEDMEKKLLDIEKDSGKGSVKWNGSSFNKRIKYLEAILRGFLRDYEEKKSYTKPMFKKFETARILTKLE